MQLHVTGAGINTMGRWLNPEIDSNNLFCPVNNATQSYQLVYELVDGNCIVQDSFEIQLIEQPTVDMISTSNDICVDSNVELMLNAPEAQVVFWECSGCEFIEGSPSTNGPISIEWQQSGSYPVSVSIFDGQCTAMAFDTINVAPKLENLSISCQPTISKVSLSWDSISCASSYDIYLDGTLLAADYTQLSYVVNDLKAGQEIHVGIFAGSDCACPASYTELTCKTLKPTIDFETGGGNIIVHPNPVNSELFISTNSTGSFHYRLLDNSGLEMKADELTDKSIDVERLPPGVYLLFLESEDKKEVHIEKIIKL